MSTDCTLEVLVLSVGFSVSIIQKTGLLLNTIENVWGVIETVTILSMNEERESRAQLYGSVS